MNISTAISTQFSFPVTFKPYENDAFVPLLQKAFDNVNLTDIVNTLRDIDHTIELARLLQDVKANVDQVRFMNSYRTEETFATTDKGQVVAMRRTLQAAVFKLDGFLADVKMVIKTQMFLLKHTTSAEINEQVQTLNAFSQPIDTQDILRAQLAVDNLKALFQYFHSLQSSSAMFTIRQNLVSINSVQPVISLGSKKFSDVDDADFEWPDPISF